MRVTDLIEHFSQTLREEQGKATSLGWDDTIPVTEGHKTATSGTLHLYAFTLPTGSSLMEDLPVSLLLPSGETEPFEGWVVGQREHTVLIQTLDELGSPAGSATLVPDASGFFQTAAGRLAEMVTNPDAYALGPAERLIPWLRPDESSRQQTTREAVSSAVFSTVWSDEPELRRRKLASLVVELIRGNKRLLVVSPDHQRSDDATGGIARALRGASLPFKSLICRYEMPVQQEAGGMALAELGFEAQMHRFYAKSRADKDSLRKKYNRFRELTPLLAYKAEKQHDLDEVKNLEWRLLTRITELHDKIKEVDTTLAEYEALPIWRRLTMQTMGQNVQTLGEYRILYQQQIEGLLQELDVAKQRVAELKPEAALRKDLRPEYSDLKEEVSRLGGTRKIRELLAAEEGTNRRAFIQNRRVVTTTAAKVISDPLFARTRFDVLIADEAPLIPAAFLLAAAGLVRERIVLAGDTRDIAISHAWESATGLPLSR